MPTPLLDNRQLGTDVQRPNLLQNGSFEYWRNTSGYSAGAGFSTNGAVFADPWTIFFNGGDTGTIQQDNANSEYGGNTARINLVYSAGGGLSRIYQNIPYNGLLSRTITFSARVKCSQATSIRLSIDCQTTGVDNFTYSNYHSGGGAYETLSVTATVLTSTTTLQFNVHIGASTGASYAYLDNAAAVLGTVAPGADYGPQNVYPDAIPNNRMASDVGPRTNLLVNGGFEIWTRGAPIAPAVNGYGPDGWFVYANGGKSLSLSQDTTNVDVGSGIAMAVNWSLMADSLWLAQRIKDPALLQQLRGRPVTASIRIRNTSISGASMNGAIGLYSDAGTIAGCTGQPPGTAYQTFWVTGVVPTNAVYLDCRIQIVTGVTTGQLQYDNAMLVVGTVPVDYVPLHVADETVRCQRYYERIDLAVNQWISTGMAYAATNAVFPIQWKTTKAVAPTVTTSAIAGFVTNNSAGGAITFTSVTPQNVALHGCHINGGVASGLVAGNACPFQGAASSPGTIYIEANP